MEKEIEFDAFWFPSYTNFDEDKSSIMLCRDFAGFGGKRFGQEKVHVTFSPACPEHSSQDKPDYKAMWEELQSEADVHYKKALKRRHRNLEQFWFNLIRAMAELQTKHTPQGTAVQSQEPVKEPDYKYSLPFGGIDSTNPVPYRHLMIPVPDKMPLGSRVEVMVWYPVEAKHIPQEEQK